MFDKTIRDKIADMPYGSPLRCLYKLVLGEYQNKSDVKSMASEEASNQLGHSIVKKIIASNNTTIGYLKDDDARKPELLEENVALQGLLPSYMTREEVDAEIRSQNLSLKSFGNDGQAVGMVMKHFKAKGLPVEGSTVKEAVLALRNA